MSMVLWGFVRRASGGGLAVPYQNHKSGPLSANCTACLPGLHPAVLFFLCSKGKMRKIHLLLKK